MLRQSTDWDLVDQIGFNGHPPLGVNATDYEVVALPVPEDQFQWAPTLGGECYSTGVPLSGVATVGFNGHPPLGVNATPRPATAKASGKTGFNGHPPLGVNATRTHPRKPRAHRKVSMGTHPWG